MDLFPTCPPLYRWRQGSPGHSSASPSGTRPPLKSRGIQVAENKINSIINQVLSEKLQYTRDDFDKVRAEIADIEKTIIC